MGGTAPAPTPASDVYYVTGANLALESQGGRAEASSEVEPFPATALNDGVRQNINYWNDATRGEFPDWAQIVWPEPKTVSQVVLRLPAINGPDPVRTVGPLEVSYRDPGTESRVAIAPTDGAENPIASWTTPQNVADGSEVRVLAFDAVETDAIRVTYSGGNSDGWSFMEEIEAYNLTPATAPFAVTKVNDDPQILQPNDVTKVKVQVTDAQGFNIKSYPVTFTMRTHNGGAVLASDADPATPGVQVLSDVSGEAEAAVRLGPDADMNQFVASTATGDSNAVFKLHALEPDQALRRSTDWLESEAERLEAGSRIEAHDGTQMYTPDGVGNYKALWMRDFAYMVEGYPEGMPLGDIRENIEYLLGGQRADGAMPDHVQGNGVPQYCPNNDNCVSMGPEPTADNSPFAVKLVYDYWKLSGDLSLFNEHSADLIRALRFTRRSPDNSLVYILPERSGSPYGFTDGVFKTGDLLFTSLLYYEAADNLSQMLATSGDDATAQQWKTEARQVKADVQTLYDPESGMFLAASLQNRQIDVWGSAYAAYLGVATKSQQLGVAQYLKDNFDDLVLRGQARQLAPGEFWEHCTLDGSPGVYQNGGYWGTGNTWIALTLAKVDRSLAQQMLIDMTKDYMENGINEWVSDNPPAVGVREYVSTATNPIPAMNELSKGD